MPKLRIGIVGTGGMANAHAGEFKKIKGVQVASQDAYRHWRQNLGRPLLVQDIDQVEYRCIDNQVVPVALLELTKVDWDNAIRPGYFTAIRDRML